MRKLLLMILLAVGFVSVFGKNTSGLSGIPVSVSSATSASSELSALQFPGDTAALYPFYHLLDSLQRTGQGHINVLHIGASHVQAGVFSHRMRWHFAQLCDTTALASRGLIFPYSAARTNNPPHYKVRSQGQWKTTRNVFKDYAIDLGMSGIAISTQDTSARVTVALNKDSGLLYRFSQIRLLTNRPSPSFIPCVDDSLLGHYDKQTQSWTFHLEQQKDSFCLSFVQNNFAKDFWDSQALSFDRDSVECFQLNGIMLDNENPGITYHAIGVNGASVNDYIRCAHFQRDMQLLHPDLVIFGIGINDATKPEFTQELFVHQYDTLINYLQASNPDLTMIFMTNNDSYIKRKTPNKKALVAQAAFVELAGKNRAALWDLFDMMGGLGSAMHWKEKGLMKSDLVHFSIEGYEYLGDLLFGAIMLDYQHYLETSCRNPKNRVQKH